MQVEDREQLTKELELEQEQEQEQRRRRGRSEADSLLLLLLKDLLLSHKTKLERTLDSPAVGV